MTEQKPNFKYVVIISQYYHSYHHFVVKFETDFIEKARLFTEELEEYKRSEHEQKRDFNYGDLDPRWARLDKPRHNVNDAGDIYFLSKETVSGCVREVAYYNAQAAEFGKGRKKNAVLEDISKHHDYGTILKLVKLYFTLA